MNLKINKWYGRLGNNIIQLKNAIQIALFYDYNIIIPYHEYFNTQYIKINDSINENDSIKFLNDGDLFFFWKEKIENIDVDLFNKNIDKTIIILKKIFKIKNCIPSNTNDVVIHIRSGDIFYLSNHDYITPPLSYYINILNSNNFDNITIIAENHNNPCIQKLLDLYKNIIFKIQSLYQDINLLLSATNVIESFGTFSASLIILSDNIKNIYRPSYQCKLFDYNVLKINVYETELSNYHKLVIPWINSEEQHNIMLTY